MTTNPRCPQCGGTKQAPLVRTNLPFFREYCESDFHRAPAQGQGEPLKREILNIGHLHGQTRPKNDDYLRVVNMKCDGTIECVNEGQLGVPATPAPAEATIVQTMPVEEALRKWPEMAEQIRVAASQPSPGSALEFYQRKYDGDPDCYIGLVPEKRRSEILAFAEAYCSERLRERDAQLAKAMTDIILLKSSRGKAESERDRAREALRPLRALIDHIHAYENGWLGEGIWRERIGLHEAMADAEHTLSLAALSAEGK